MCTLFRAHTIVDGGSTIHNCGLEEKQERKARTSGLFHFNGPGADPRTVFVRGSVPGTENGSDIQGPSLLSNQALAES